MVLGVRGGNRLVVGVELSDRLMQAFSEFISFMHCIGANLIMFFPLTE